MLPPPVCCAPPLLPLPPFSPPAALPPHIHVRADAQIDINEWMHLLPYLDAGFLHAVSAYSDAPHRNPVLRSMRAGKKAIAEALQEELYRQADAGDAVVNGRDSGHLAAPLTAAARLNYAGAAANAADGHHHHQQQQQGHHHEPKRSQAQAVLQRTEQRREGRRRRKKMQNVDSMWTPASRSAGALDLFGTG